jgi:hypothetical protein
VVFPVAPPRPCCAHTRQSKRPLSVQIVHNRICDNLLSSLFIYIDCKEANLARHALEFLGHKQPPTPMQTDNTTALGVVNNNVVKKLKSMDMEYHWFQCWINQRQFPHYWAAGKSNNKHHAPIHHQITRPAFLTPLTILQKLCNRIQSQLPVARVC